MRNKAHHLNLTAGARLNFLVGRKALRGEREEMEAGEAVEEMEGLAADLAEVVVEVEAGLDWAAAAEGSPPTSPAAPCSPPPHPSAPPAS
jgi:hypothetical protein